MEGLIRLVASSFGVRIRSAEARWGDGSSATGQYEPPVERYMRDAKLCDIGEGSSRILVEAHCSFFVSCPGRFSRPVEKKARGLDHVTRMPQKGTRLFRVEWCDQPGAQVWQLVPGEAHSLALERADAAPPRARKRTAPTKS